MIDRQKAAVRWLAQRPNACLDRAEVIAATGLSDGDYEELLPALAAMGHVERIPVDDGVFFSGFQVQSSMPSFARQIDKPVIPKVKLSDGQITAVHFLSGSVGYVLDRQTVLKQTGLNTAQYEIMVRALEARGCIEVLHDPDKVKAPTIRILEPIHEFAAELAEQADRAGGPISSTIYTENVHMGDSYHAGQVGAMGPGAHAHDIDFKQVWNQNNANIDLNELQNQLATLRQSMSKCSSDPDHEIAIGSVSAAEKAAAAGDGPKALGYLKSAGQWTLDVATKVGVPVAVTAIKQALGLQP